ncbi:alpha/beta fold hydrolase [Alsobacter sp. R-9]
MIVVAPYALHHASIADLAPGHSIVQRLLGGAFDDVWLTEWKSATPERAGITIDSLLADLLVAVEEAGNPVDLVGLCQGGWLSLAFAARFPSRTRRLVLAGAPVDFAVASSRLTEALHNMLPPFAEIGSSRSATVGGRHLLALWGVTTLDAAAMQAMLQLDGPPEAALAARVQNWYLNAVDLPGAYLGEVIDRLFRRNELATGRFAALGRTLSLKAIESPMCLLVGTADDIAPPQQALAARRLVGTAEHDVQVLEADCGHLALFLGRRTLDGPWCRIVDWLGQDRP